MTTADQRIRVLLVDDHPAVLLGYRSLTNVCDQITIIGTAASGEQALTCANELRPDIVLMDLQMDGIGGIEAIRRIRAELPHTAVIVVSGFHSQTLILDAITAGATGYLNKELALRPTASAIQLVAAGGAAFGPKAAPMIADLIRKITESPFDLTNRERTVISYLCEGLTEREIGQRIGISRHTVQNHISEIRRKLNAHERADIIAVARKHGLC